MCVFLVAFHRGKKYILISYDLNVPQWSLQHVSLGRNAVSVLSTLMNRSSKHRVAKRSTLYKKKKNWILLKNTNTQYSANSSIIKVDLICSVLTQFSVQSLLSWRPLTGVFSSMDCRHYSRDPSVSPWCCPGNLEWGEHQHCVNQIEKCAILWPSKYDQLSMYVATT